MIEASFIEKKTLPIARNFELLQERGLAYIQEHSSKAWSNLNPSDSGVTILEQLCFAFTELGYCNNFPIKDILTNREGELLIKNQFYLPENILTITPITLQDYIKYLIDRVEGVKNVTAEALKTTLNQVRGAYQFELLLSDYALIEEVTEQGNNPVCNAAFFELNYARNLGEYFFTPNYLLQKSYQVNGILEVDARFELVEVLKNIQYQVNNYIFPNVTQTGYPNLKEKGLTTNDIFNGPILKNGWIPDASMQAKKDTIKNFEVMKEIRLVPGVVSISNVSFLENKLKTSEITSQENEILFLDFVQSYDTGTFIVMSEGVQKKELIKVEQIKDLVEMEQPKNQVDSVAAVQMAPHLPKGKYRDIDDYYSIQHTFPQSYGLGLNSPTGNETPFQKAQTSQLRGYLTLYDQALINQFAQLANLGKLFSFKNSITGTPYDQSEFYKKQTRFEKEHPKYPAPFESFSPTYYYQSLYKTSPDLERLLKNYDAYRYSLGLKTPKELDHIGWEGYKGSPYNSYIWGLMVYMEKENVNLDRRNEMLNHLLARYGESPLVINTIVNNPVYSANLEKDRVIIKSMYLQNLQVLYYNKSKAYNYLAADVLDDTLETKYQLLLQKLEEISGFHAFKPVDKDKITPAIETEANLMLNGFTHASQNNFIFDVDRIDKREKISALDIINFATVQLKLNLLFGLNEYYQNNIVEYPKGEGLDESAIYSQKKNLLWVMTRLKGMFFIETNLLINSADFKLTDGEYYQINNTERPEEFSYKDLIDAFQNIGNDPVCTDITGVWGIDKEKSLNDPLLEHTFILVFPDFLKTDEFEARLEFYLQSELSPQLSYTYLFVDTDQLNTLIPIYNDWHNSLIYKNSDSEVLTKLVPEDPKTYAWNLLTELEDIQKNQPELNE